MFLIIFLLFIALAVFTMLSYKKLWNKTKKPSIFYWLICAVIFATTFFSVFSYKLIPFKWLGYICMFISAITVIVLLYSAILFLISLLIKLVAKLIKHDNNKFINFLKSTKSISLIFVITFILGVAGFVNSGILRVTDYSINIDKTSVNKEINIAMLSDTHVGIGTTQSGIDDLVKTTNELNADAIVLVGDIIDESTSDENLDYMSNAFKNFKSKYGTYFVYGNHETYINNEKNTKLTYALTNAGIKILKDEAVTIADDVTIIGRNDMYKGQASVESVIEKYNVDTNNPIIVLNHEPLNLQSIADAGADLSFSGHTHGEQFPFTAWAVSLVNDMVYGQKSFGNMTAITSSGVGQWGVHYKLFGKSEVVNAKLTFK